MNKFFIGIMLCLLVTQARSMEQPWRLHQRWLKEFGDGPAKALELRKTLLPKEKDMLDYHLSKLFEWGDHAPDPYEQAKSLLDQGASPNERRGDYLLNTFMYRGWSWRKNSKKLVNLLLAYGADPRQGWIFEPPITHVTNIETLRIFLQVGVDINAAERYDNATVLTRCMSPFTNKGLILSVWALRHHADPNPSRKSILDVNSIPPVHCALNYSRELDKLIALLQYGARLDTVYHGETPLEYARTCLPGYTRDRSRAQYELLWAISEKHLDPCNLTQTACKACGISDESTDLIVAAAQKVDKARAKARLADIKYEHGNLTKYVLDRAIGHSVARK